MFASTGWQVGTLAAGAVLTMLVLALEHWFPWVKRLSRIQAYIYGTMAILLGFTAWRLLNGDWQSPVGLAVIASLGGGVVILAYKVDDVVLRLRKANTAAMPDTTEMASAKLAQMRARVRDVKDEIGLAFLPTLSVLLETVGDLADRYLPPLLSKIGELAPKVAEVAGEVGEFVGALLEGESPVEALKDLLGDLFPAIADMDWGELGRSVLERIGAGFSPSGGKI